MNETAVRVIVLIIYVIAMRVSYVIARSIFIEKGYEDIPLYASRFVFFPPLLIGSALLSNKALRLSEEIRNFESHNHKKKSTHKIEKIVTFVEAGSNTRSLCLGCNHYKEAYSICSRLKSDIKKPVESCLVYEKKCV